MGIECVPKIKEGTAVFRGSTLQSQGSAEFLPADSPIAILFRIIFICAAEQTGWIPSEVMG